MSATSLLERWAVPGTPGAVDDPHLGGGLPSTWLGLVAGAVGSRDALLAPSAPWPGLDEIQAPLAWYDSSRVVIGADAAWRGFGASLVELRTYARPVRTAKPRAAFTVVNGGAGVDRNTILLARGDGAGWLRAGALSEERAAVALLGRRGQHAWFLDAGRVRGPHTLRATYTQRGLAGATRVDDRFVDLIGGVRPPYLGFEEAARGEAGVASWEWARDDRRARVTVRRSHDHRESSESPFQGVQFVFAEREAQQNTLEAEVSREHAGRVRALRLELTQAQVTRSADFLGTLTPRRWRQRTVWFAARAAQPWAGGTLEAQGGVGLQTAPEHGSERVQFAPSLEWRTRLAASRFRVHAGRQVTPLWSDLAPGVGAFTQDVWSLGAEDAIGDRKTRWLEVSVIGARIGSAAHLERSPIRDVALRDGWRVTGPRGYDAMVTLATGARRGVFALDASGFARVRPRFAFEALTEPAVGARLGAESSFRAFTGDLGVTLRLEGAWIGARECASRPEESLRPIALPGYATFEGSLMLELGDARFGLHAFNLEDVAHPQAWADPSGPPSVVTPGLGAGRQVRFELAWPFFN